MKRHIALLMSTAFVVLDQFFKILAMDKLEPIGSLPIIPDIFHLTYIENRGAAFGMMEGKKWVLIGLTAAVLLVAVLLVLAGKLESNNHLLFSVCTIIGGGVGNLIDRIYRGFVVDYIHLKLINFAVFNFADCCITVGAFMIIAYEIYEIISERKKKAETDDSTD